MRHTNGLLAIFMALVLVPSVGARGIAPGDWAVVGSAVDKDGYLLLTPDELVQGGAVWQREQVDLREGFDRTFVLSFGDDDEGADGIVFVLQQVGLEAIGGQGESIGYAGISPSVGVEFDTFQNGGDLADDHVAVDENGSVAHEGLAPVALPNLEDGREHLARFTWSPEETELAVELDGQPMLVYTKDMVADIFGDDPLVYLGFTAGTGGARNTQYVRPATPSAELTWVAPAGGGLDAPTGFDGAIVGLAPPDVEGIVAAPGPVVAYNIYRSSTPGVVPGPATLFATLPPGRLTARAPLATGATYFVITGVYGTGESAPSNEVALGGPGATLTNVKAKATKITAKGTDFTGMVRVYLDGVSFSDPATVKNLKKVTQKGALATGQTLRSYLTSGRTITITFVNDDESVVSITQTLR